MANPEAADPSDEARRIFFSIFRRASTLPRDLPPRFAAASRLLFGDETPESQARYRKVLRDVGDLEAFEIACRLRRRDELLVAKFRLMVYLAECHPEVRPFLVNDRDGLFKGLWVIAASASWTAYKFLKGLWLLRCTR